MQQKCNFHLSPRQGLRWKVGHVILERVMSQRFRQMCFVCVSSRAKHACWPECSNILSHDSKTILSGQTHKITVCNQDMFKHVFLVPS